MTKLILVNSKGNSKGQGSSSWISKVGKNSAHQNSFIIGWTVWTHMVTIVYKKKDFLDTYLKTTTQYCNCKLCDAQKLHENKTIISKYIRGNYKESNKIKLKKKKICVNILQVMPLSKFLVTKPVKIVWLWLPQHWCGFEDNLERNEYCSLYDF